MDVVSFEKAKELKAAGFPQEHAFKKVYWEVDCKDDKGNLFKTFKICIYMLGYMAMPYLVPLEFKGEHVIPGHENIYYAPGFLDLMRQLPSVRIDLNDGLTCDDLANMWLTSSKMKAIRTKEDYLHSWYIERMYRSGMPLFTDLTESEKESLRNTLGFNIWLLVEMIRKSIGSIIRR